MSILYHWWDIGQWSANWRIDQSKGHLFFPRLAEEEKITNKIEDCFVSVGANTVAWVMVWFYAVGTTDLELVQRNKTGSNICLAIAKQIMVLFYPRKKIQQSW